ncbi:2-succinyl-6-hydroxy-2,4-cyclohexadiene-1-carboxylate synthase [Rubrobacter marinus]|uniref:Putative 2-succinyl-6-hydroxy-2,4-cyclohexadiene-1-carboxylate synthase n=1 Tax=Rubrobacter marinus TaxID=2653852 RepID=A0A6G8Q0B9_9ACTN|nr:2-succinyl-6-hydroxy-2,4-cyclohexadiene-1-carboxylate synthase [Rubrobacter marinus]QIN79929.1 2-succinyl-6-hydroxy-2,4-cyclohexadiene-1-carboxylate synthase [Rubrobacter marinus]
MAALSYATLGASGRPAVLFLHGFMGSSGDWREVLQAIGDEAFAVAVDLPGHGASLGLPPEVYAFEGAARAVIGVLNELGIDRASLVGYSMGGRLALYLALRHPERCSGLFLESASPGLRDAEERASRRAADEEKARRLESEDFETFLRDWYRQPLFASLARDEGLLRRTLEERRRNDPAELARSLRGMGTGSQPSLWEELSGLRVPALAVAGELDEKFVGISRRMAELGPCIEAATVPGVGHNVRAEARRRTPVC